MTRRTIAILGTGQCVNWGVLYYAFAVLLLPVERDLGVANWIVAGAFSLALLMSAVFAPMVGRWADRGHAPLVMQVGGFSAAAILASWALVPSLAALYVVWAGLGLCMAATLYEPAFAIVGRAHGHAAARLRALAAITLFGGLASTVFLPLSAVLIERLGWRGTVCVLALVLAASTYVTRVCVFRSLPSGTLEPGLHDSSATPGYLHEMSGRLGFAILLFSVASLAAAAFTANVVPALTERGVTTTTAAMLGGLLGVMQLPGRALLMKGALAGPPARLIAISLALQASGLVCMALAPSVWVIAGGVMVFAAGAGLTTLLRPHFVQTAFNIRNAGYVNGRLARSQQLARAAGPIIVAWSARSLGYSVVFLLIGLAFAALALCSPRLLDRFVSIEREGS